MIRSSIDLGTNTCLLLIAEWDPAKKSVTRSIEDHSTIVRLGKGVDQTRQLDPAAIERTIECLKQYADRARANGIDPAQTVAVATATARDAKNGAQFFERVTKETGFRFRTLSGDQEAKYTFLGGLLPGQDPAHSAVIDIGGGSTELMGQTGGHSIDIGSVRFTERYLQSDPVTDTEFWACQEAIDEALQALAPHRERMPLSTQLVGVAGTATTLASWHIGIDQFNAAKIDQVTLTRGDVHRQVEDLKWRTVAERRELTGIEEGRADVLLAGALILWRAMECLGFPDVKISTRGLRYGVLELDP